MNLKEIIQKQLKELGADGLVNTEVDQDGCGCGIDDLCPCDSPNLDDCRAAKFNQWDNLFYPV